MVENEHENGLGRRKRRLRFLLHTLLLLPPFLSIVSLSFFLPAAPILPKCTSLDFDLVYISLAH